MGSIDVIRFMKKIYSPYFFSLPLVLTVFFAFVLPYGAAFVNAFGAAEKISVFKNSAILHITFFTVKQAFFSVLVSLAIGLPGAWLMGSRRNRFSPFIRTITAIPFAMPQFLWFWVLYFFSETQAGLTGL